MTSHVLQFLNLKMDVVFHLLNPVLVPQGSLQSFSTFFASGLPDFIGATLTPLLHVGCTQ